MRWLMLLLALVLGFLLAEFAPNPLAKWLREYDAGSPVPGETINQLYNP